MLGSFVQIFGPTHRLQSAESSCSAWMRKTDASSSSPPRFAVLFGLNWLLRRISATFGGERQKTAFWTRQGISLILFVLAVVKFDNPSRLATGAGLAFAMQKVVTSFAGYFVILPR